MIDDYDMKQLNHRSNVLTELEDCTMFATRYMYSRFQVGCPKIAARTQNFLFKIPAQNGTHVQTLSTIFGGNRLCGTISSFCRNDALSVLSQMVFAF